MSTYSNNPVSINYIDENGKIIDLPSVNVIIKSWACTFTVKSGTRLYYSAALQGGSDDIFYATITVDTLQVDTLSQKGSIGPDVLEFTIPPE